MAMEILPCRRHCRHLLFLPVFLRPRRRPDRTNFLPGITSAFTGVKIPMTTFAIGVDLGGTNLRIAAVNSNGKVLEKITTSTEVARGRDFVIDEMCAAIQHTFLKFHAIGQVAG